MMYKSLMKRSTQQQQQQQETVEATASQWRRNYNPLSLSPVEYWQLQCWSGCAFTV